MTNGNKLSLNSASAALRRGHFSSQRSRGV